MAMGQQKDRQGDLMVSWSEMPPRLVNSSPTASPGGLPALLGPGGAFGATRALLPYAPGGHFEGIKAWAAALREFLLAAGIPG